MNLHEYQAKLVLQKYGIPVPEFFIISTLQEGEELIKRHSLSSAVLKVQIHAGGRGKAGGIKVARNPEEILQGIKELLGKKIVNNQTGPSGIIVQQIMLTTPIEILKEYYLGIVIDRQKAQSVLIASPSGGVDIEKIAEESPDQVLRLPIPQEGFFRPYHLLRISKFMNWKGSLADQGISIISALVKAFLETDASLIEINPLAETSQDQLLALDAKLTIDDNALFRQPELKRFFDPSQMPLNEARAQQYELAYVSLEGDIGCMVNGAGLAMATMDIIQYYGGKPANFLDVGGGASQEKVTEGFKIILSDPHVKAILINIFGGIMNCGTLALGIIAAAKELQVSVPLIVRMEGTNVEEGKRLLNEANLHIVVAQSLEEAAQKVVAAAKERRSVSHVHSDQ